MGEGILKYIMESFFGGRNRNGVQMYLNPFSLTLGPAESKREVLAVEIQLAFSFLYDCGHIALAAEDTGSAPVIFIWAFQGVTDWKAGCYEDILRLVFDTWGKKGWTSDYERMTGIRGQAAVLKCGQSLSFWGVEAGLFLRGRSGLQTNRLWVLPWALSFWSSWHGQNELAALHKKKSSSMLFGQEGELSWKS